MTGKGTGRGRLSVFGGYLIIASWWMAIMAVMPLSAGGQVLDSLRRTDWRQPGRSGNYLPDAQVDVLQFGADSSGVWPCDEAVLQAMNALQGPGRVHFPPGRYRFTQSIILRDSVFLEGERDALTGLPASHLLLGPGENRDGILLQGQEWSTGIQVLDTLKQGQFHIRVEDPEIFQPGDILRLHALDDSLLVFNTWALHTTGQLLTVASVQDDTLWLDRPLRRDYDPGRPPLLYEVQPILQAGVICLGLERTDSTGTQTANISLIHARDCLIAGIHSRKANFAHVDVRSTSRTTIVRNYCTEGHGYGGGGRAYGVMLQAGTAECLVTGNIFRQLRHSMILQSGANGNVLAYNVSRSPYWTGTVLPADAAGDLVLHGNYPYFNLFEGNVVQNIVIDDSHDKNGPYNTFFRNRAELYGIFMNANPPSGFQHFIGNQVVNTSAPWLGLFLLQGTGHYSYGNVVKGQIQPPGTTEPAETSLFDYPFGSWYTHIGSIPPIRTDNAGNPAPLTETVWRESGGEALWSACHEPEYGPVYVTILSGASVMTIRPNPCRGSFVVQRPDAGTDRREFALYDISGREILRGETGPGETAFDATGIPPGCYFWRSGGDGAGRLVVLP